MTDDYVTSFEFAFDAISGFVEFQSTFGNRMDQQVWLFGRGVLRDANEA